MKAHGTGRLSLLLLGAVLWTLAIPSPASASPPDPMDRLLPGDILLESASPDNLFQEQRIAYGARFTHSSIYVGVRNGRHMVVEAVGPKHESRMSAIEDKYFSDSYNTYQLVRVMAASVTQRELAARIAEKCFVGVPYGWQTEDISPFALFFIRYGLDKNRLSSLYCSSLVWNAWRVAGVDLDSDYVGSFGTFMSVLFMPRPYFVMPDDIAMSSEVQYIIDIPLPEAPELEVWTPVPRVVGMNESAAKEALVAAGFHVKISRRSDNAAKGTVVEQAPSSAYAREGTQVELTVSNGVEMVRVPDVLAAVQPANANYSADVYDMVEGAFEAEARAVARAVLGRAGLKMSFVVFANQEGQGGNMDTQSPRAGTMVPRGTVVRVRIGQGEY